MGIRRGQCWQSAEQLGGRPRKKSHMSGTKSRGQIIMIIPQGALQGALMYIYIYICVCIYTYMCIYIRIYMYINNDT